MTCLNVHKNTGNALLDQTPAPSSSEVCSHSGQPTVQGSPLEAYQQWPSEAVIAINADSH